MKQIAGQARACLKSAFMRQIWHLSVHARPPAASSITRVCASRAHRQSSVHRTRTHANQWAQATDAAISERRFFPQLEARRHTVADAIDRYLDDLPLRSLRDERNRRASSGNPGAACATSGPISTGSLAARRHRLFCADQKTAYFAGCSTGGRMANMEARKFRNPPPRDCYGPSVRRRPRPPSGPNPSFAAA
jgi:hypothetical protein